MTGHLTTAELAQVLRVPEDQVLAWHATGCPALDATAGVWELDAVRAWLTQELLAARRAEENVRGDVRAAEFDRKRALADRTRFELERLQDQFVSRAEVRQLLARVASTLRQAFHDLPHKLEGGSAAEIERELEDLLDQLAEQLDGVRV